MRCAVWGLDLNGEGKVDAQDVRVLTSEKALEIFVDEYFHKPGLDASPEPLQASVFDMCVNAGGNAAKVLSRLRNHARISVAVDGVIGPQTSQATAQAMAAAPDHFVDAYGIARRNYYYGLAYARAVNRKYARRRAGGNGGWIVRGEEFIYEKYHLSVAAHSKRDASWG